MTRPTFTVLVIAVLTFGTLSCSQSLAMWVIAGSTVDRLLFGVGLTERDTNPVAVFSLSVRACYVPDTVPGRVYWDIVYAGSGGTPKFRQVEYGKTPSSYRARVEPRPLSPSSCYYAGFHKSRSSYPEGWVTFLTDSLGQVAPIDGLALDRMKLPGSQPLLLSDTARIRTVADNPSVVRQAILQVLEDHGFKVVTADSTTIATEQLKVGRTWDDLDVAERVDCGRWVEGGDRVRLPLSRDSAGGYGHLLIKMQVYLAAVSSGTAITVDPEIWLNPPWFEQGDRPMMPCSMREPFARVLLDEIESRSRSLRRGA